MQLLVVRHAIAEDRRGSMKDADRALTEEGKEKFARGTQGLKTVCGELDRIISSTYVRAIETADILSKAFGNPTQEKSELLTPEKEPSDTMSWLRSQYLGERVAIVSHEPFVSHFISYSLAESDEGNVDFKKGAAVLLEVTPYSCQLLWAMPPKVLRFLGSGKF